MKIIDTETGKRVPGIDKEINLRLAKQDPIKRNVEKSLGLEEHSPMDPPEAYETTGDLAGFDQGQMPQGLLDFVEDHKEAIGQTTKFEALLNEFHTAGYHFTREIHEGISAFFQYFDDELLPHNRREERGLFPVLNERLIASGEHSKGPEKTTAIDLFEDDHVKFIQLGTLCFNLLGLVTRLPDAHSRALVADLAFHTGKELVELIKLHIYREDHTLFPLASQLLTEEELAALH